MLTTVKYHTFHTSITQVLWVQIAQETLLTINQETLKSFEDLILLSSHKPIMKHQKEGMQKKKKKKRQMLKGLRAH